MFGDARLCDVVVGSGAIVGGSVSKVLQDKRKLTYKGLKQPLTYQHHPHTVVQVLHCTVCIMNTCPKTFGAAASDDLSIQFPDLDMAYLGVLR